MRDAQFQPTKYEASYGEFEIQVLKSDNVETGGWDWGFAILGPNAYTATGSASTKELCFERALEIAQFFEELPYK